MAVMLDQQIICMRTQTALVTFELSNKLALRLHVAIMYVMTKSPLSPLDGAHFALPMEKQGHRGALLNW